MERVIRKLGLHEDASDYTYWSTKSVGERLAAVEALRQQYLALHPNAPSRLQRVCRVVKRA